MALNTSRRSFLSATSLLTLAATGVARPAEASRTCSSIVKDRISISKESVVVAIASGQLRGYRRNSVNIFKGIPYAGATADKARFLRAPPVAPWTGVRNALNYGPICPQPNYNTEDISQDEEAFLIPHGPPTIQSEDCLRINIWTSSDMGGKRPIMLWLHPNGFNSGCAQDYLATDGENLARNQGVVVASINHRLNAFGYLNVQEIGGGRYADSGNVGMLDIIDALRWLRANGAAFGGDPDNITIFGQSGGGEKVSVLLAMPEAKGLFQKAIIQSGALLGVHTLSSSAVFTRAIMSSLGLDHKNLDGLLSTPNSRLVEALNAIDVMHDYAESINADEANREPWKWRPLPVCGTPSLPSQPFEPKAPETGRDVPLLVMSALNEYAAGFYTPNFEDADWDVVRTKLSSRLGTKTDAIVAAFRSTYPRSKPVEALSMLFTTERPTAITMCERVVQRGGAPVYNSIFQWRTALFDGRPRAYHTSDMAFVFDNTDLVDQQTGGGGRARALSKIMSTAWAQFARTGNPNGPGVPHWPAFDLQTRSTMLFDDKSEAVSDPDGAIRVLLSES